MGEAHHVMRRRESSKRACEWLTDPRAHKVPMTNPACARIAAKDWPLKRNTHPSVAHNIVALKATALSGVARVALSNSAHNAVAHGARNIVVRSVAVIVVRNIVDRSAVARVGDS